MLVSLCLVLAAHAPHFTAPPGAPITDKKALASIEAYLESCEFFGWSGAVLVEHKGRVILSRGYGKADPDQGIDCDGKTVFEVASVTKPFTACGILALVEDGRVDLDKSISEYLPGVPEERRNITVRHLLSHTSGMGRTVGVSMGFDLAAVVRGTLSPRTVRDPGDTYEYWNQGYALLAGIIENVTEEGYLDFMRERIFAKAKLKSTGFTGDELWPLDQQAVARAEGAPLRHAAGHPYGAYGYQYRGMGGMVTTVDELWKLGRAALDGKLLDKSATREMLEVVSAGYALGWRVQKTRRGTLQVGHGGDVKGFHTSMDFFPEEDAAIVAVSCVNEVDTRQLAWNLQVRLLEEGEGAYGVPAIQPIKAGLLEGCAGTYGDEAGLTLTVRALGPGLEIRGEDLGGASLVSGSVDVDASTRLAESTEGLVTALIQGNPAPIAEVMAKRIPSSWPGQLASSIYPDRVADMGELQGITPLACRGAGTPRSACFLRLDYESGSVVLKVEYSVEGLEIFDLNAAAPNASMRFAQVAEPGAGAKRGRQKKAKDPVLSTHHWSAFRRQDPTHKLRFEPSLRKPEILILDVPGMGEVRLRRLK